MDISLTGSGYFLPMVIIGIVIVVVITAVLFHVRSKKGSFPKRDLKEYPARNHLDYQPDAKPILVIQPKGIQPAVSPVPKVTAAEVPKETDVDLTSTCRDMTGSLGALVEKYSLNNFTIATADGLIFSSSGGDTAQVDAATFSEIFKSDPTASTPGVVLFGITHKGSDLIGIVREKAPLPKKTRQQIATDTKVILNWWI
jgi:hypothetical protein